MKSSHPLEREELMAWLDGELRPELAAGAEAHLESCAECRAAVADLRGVSQQLASWKSTERPMEIPAALRSAVDAHVADQKKRDAAHRRNWRQIFGTRRLIWAGGTLIILLGIIVALKIAPKLMVSRFSANDSEVGEYLEKGNFKKGMAIKELPAKSVISAASTIDWKTNEASASQVEYGTTTNHSSPMIARTAQLSLVTKDFEKARASAEEILKRHGGYIGQLDVNAPAGAGRTLTAVFRVPSMQLDATLIELKKLGRVIAEAQSGEEVTQQYVDLQARLANARHTEQRLSDLLRDRTGKLSDVLEFEKEIDRVRGEIESMEAQRKSLAKQVDYATLNTTLSEEYGARLQLTPPSTATRFRNAAVDGYEALAGGVVGVLLFLLSAGPSLLVLGGILFFAGRMIWKRVRGRIA
jgi:hypothetical protein